MGGRLQIRPTRILETVTEELKSGVFPRYRRTKPVWYDAVYAIPPAEKLTRTIPIAHREPSRLVRQTRPSKTFIPHRIKYPEDELRNTFFRDHPWELARPRLIVELDGKDALRFDWGEGLRQPGMPLCGECVVQRQLWLMENMGMGKNAAYDKVRTEFYQLRHEEQVEQRIAREEAMYVGAYFGKQRLEISMEIEDKVFEEWKEWAGVQMAAIRAARNPDPIVPQEKTATVAGTEPSAAPGTGAGTWTGRLSPSHQGTSQAPAPSLLGKPRRAAVDMAPPPPLSV